MAGVAPRITGERHNALLDDLCHRIGRQPLVGYAATFLDEPEDRFAFDATAIEARKVGANRARCGPTSVWNRDPVAFAFLVGLRPSNGDDETLAFGAHIDDVERDKLAASERPGKPQQDQRAVAYTLDGVRQ
jgi:hypothetical protein